MSNKSVNGRFRRLARTQELERSTQLFNKLLDNCDALRGTLTPLKEVPLELDITEDITDE